MKQTNTSNLTFKICAQCAPVMLNLKPAATLALTFDESKLLKKHLNGIDISFYPLSYKGDYITWLIYKEELLKNTLSKPEVAFLLNSIGYPLESLEQTLFRLRRQFDDCYRCKQDFPHELGLFLDYPAEDVIGFIMNKGKRCRYCGYWKVYSDVEKAKQVFYRYDLAKNTLLNEVCQGKTVMQAVHTLVS